MQLVKSDDARHRTGRIDRVALLTVHTSPLEQAGSGDGGGLNVYVRAVARRLAARGIHVDVFTRRNSRDVPASVTMAPGAVVHHIDAGPPEPVPKYSLPDHLHEFHDNLLGHHAAGDHDVVHSHYWLSGWVGRRVADHWSAPLVQTFHTLGEIKNATLAPGDEPEAPLRLAVERQIASEADRVAVLTCGEARLLHQRMGVPGSRLTVVPAGVDLDVFHSGAGPGSSVRWPQREGPALLFVGRLQRLKGPDVAIRILKEVRRTHPSAGLLIVGGPSGDGNGRTDVAALRRLADQVGAGDAVRIVPARPQEELAALYERADVLLVPSRSETFGLVALEAQAMGTPVVAADVGGLRAVVEGGGTLVAGHDPADHAAAVRRYLDDPGVRRRAGAAGRETARAASWDRTVDRLLALYADARLPDEPRAAS